MGAKQGGAPVKQKGRERMRQLSEHLFQFDDTCHVYVIKHGREAICVDFGSGAVLEALPHIGVERITDILMTHHHRDQGQGLGRAAQQGIRIWVPHAEQDLFARVDDHWQARELFNNYNMRQDRFSLLESVPIAGTLRDYAVHRFGPVDIRVLPTPGHTVGSVSFLTTVDGRKIAFTGDLIYGEGKIWSLAATQWSYNGAEGIPYTILSLLSVKEESPEWLLPSHGEQMVNPPRAIDLLVDRLWELLRHRGHNLRLFQFRDQPYEPLTPHLLRNRTSVAYSYVLLSDSGKALFIDFGYDFMAGFASGADRAARRPWLATLDALKKRFGVSKVDVAIPTHYHDDHVAGLNLLRDAEGTQVWVPRNFAAILRRPERYDLPCLWYDPISVDRELPLRTPIRWEEYTLTLYEQPGHTTHAVAISFEADGKKILAIGDQHGGDQCEQWNYVYKNGFQSSDYVESARLYQQLAPDLILTGHSEPFWVTPDFFRKNLEKGECLHQLHEQLLPLNEVNFGTGGQGAWLEPYQIEARAGKTFQLEATVTNPFAHRCEVSVSLAVPHGWSAQPETVQMTLQGHGTGTARFEVTPATQPRRRARIGLDVNAGGRKWGQLAEALVTITS
ncbi:MBL fold metallo-hydrolase [Lihuaxuella thermophila]|uniref:Glyoxylase, beta-lactamase superfamily II n=1 Tax=Lihuaxuella thermophila TaxID=1173111 RepID=A0A1H8G907_9BACL|nr:MBL fold metallo-hydrolase [Lihuaxuella thermophila]SEN40492.1 Glyoxylase, beta-lactamase superfamily II [Lihuaxuella thermophila]